MSRYAYNKDTKVSTLIAGSESPVTIAGVENTSTASQAYVIGEYLVYQGFLYKVISPIAQGATLVVNTNIQVTTVGEELQILTNKVNNKDTLIAESATTGTYAEKLNSIYSASNGLTDVQAKNSYVEIGGYKYYFVTKNRYATLPIYYSGKFSYTTLSFSSASHIESLNISSTGAISFEDASSITNNYKIRLYTGG